MRKPTVLIATIVILAVACVVILVTIYPTPESDESWRPITLARFNRGFQADRPLVIATVDLSLPNPRILRDALSNDSEFMSFVKRNQVELLTNEYRFNFENRIGVKTADDFVPDSEATQIAMEINQLIHSQHPDYPEDTFYQPRFIIAIPGDSKLYFPNSTDHANYIRQLITTGKEPASRYPRPAGSGHGG